MNKITNHLINEKSPYLLQHAHNPVNWYPWGEEAFELARKEDKPVFLSIGYSTCHWCHVMAHESFEDEEVADLINKIFIPVKVDREERPDIDGVYMQVCQMMTGRGGWPLTIFLTSERKPFYAGTYIPKKSRYGQPGILDLIEKIADLWENNRNKIIEAAGNISGLIRQMERKEGRGKEPEFELLNKAFKFLKSNFDEKNGGFGTAPKFPQPVQLLFLLNYWYQEKEDFALEMVEKTLQKMRTGGIYDQLGYGFHRYSTDPRWILPHFEKMLYDQAQLAYTYVETYQATGNELYARTTEEIFEYCNRRLTAPEGGFYSAEDADSEGVEGKFYTWKETDIAQLLTEDEVDRFLELYNIEKEGNFREESSGQMTGLNVLYIDSPTKLAMLNELSGSRKRLFQAREERIYPHLDDKILTDWNGLMIAGLARAGWILNNQEYINRAESALNFINNNLYQKDGFLYHRYRDGEVAVTGNLADYSHLIWGLIELYQATFSAKYLQQALTLNDYLFENFWDEKAGGYYFTSKEEEITLIRQKESYDGAVPSGNSIAMWNLIRLAHLTGNNEYEERALELARCFTPEIEQSPVSHLQFLTAISCQIAPFYDVVISGFSRDEDVQEMFEILRENYLPQKVVIFRESGNSEKIKRLTPFLEEYEMVNNRATAYICRDYSCDLPVNNKEDMIKQLFQS